MKTDGLVLLALDLAFLLAIFVVLARIQSRLERIERRLFSRSSNRQKRASSKKD
ncbi:hypothetical protein [Sulfobacillus harzensis]|uniref:Uncharacterized protein n=1 Tax=Sulfobacillus harzensis TaxID=2729629 RepID=A0A7Y0L1Y1_9FIRM|nr:hypothetical protein [Sulfobacillus harzensis]NMP21236.1 hypothetical protein [Sulfobacillus harzensis]